LISQIIGTLLGVTIAFVGSYVIYGVIKMFMGIRLSQEEEYDGADLSIHKISATPAND
jgi:Amt family ammonium transporter